MSTNTIRLCGGLSACLATVGLMSISSGALQAHAIYASKGSAALSLMDGGQSTLPSDPTGGVPQPDGQRDGGES